MQLWKMRGTTVRCKEWLVCTTVQYYYVCAAVRGHVNAKQSLKDMYEGGT